MSPRSIHPFGVFQLVCAFLLLQYSNWPASMVSGHLQSSTRVLQHKSDLLGDGDTLCDQTLKTDYTANLKECETKAYKLFPGLEDIDSCRRLYSELSCQTDLACQHCDEQLQQDWLRYKQTLMIGFAETICKDSHYSFQPFYCRIIWFDSPTTTPPTTITNTTANSTTSTSIPQWAIYTLVPVIIASIVLVFLILLICYSRSNGHSHHNKSDTTQGRKAIGCTRSARGKSSSQANHSQGKLSKLTSKIAFQGKKGTFSGSFKQGPSGSFSSKVAQPKTHSLSKVKNSTSNVKKSH